MLQIYVYMHLYIVFHTVDYDVYQYIFIYTLYIYE